MRLGSWLGTEVWEWLRVGSWTLGIDRSKITSSNLTGRYRLGVRTRGSQPRDRGSNPRTGTNLQLTLASERVSRRQLPDREITPSKNKI